MPHVQLSRSAGARFDSSGALKVKEQNSDVVSHKERSSATHNCRDKHSSFIANKKHKGKEVHGNSREEQQHAALTKHTGACQPQNDDSQPTKRKSSSSVEVRRGDTRLVGGPCTVSRVAESNRKQIRCGRRADNNMALFHACAGKAPRRTNLIELTISLCGGATSRCV
eukprot:scaffold176813_cov32-Tisochrysis_lutea.AAC.1